MPDHKILYIIRCGLPESAAGIRVFQMARLLQKNGYIVNFLCADPVAAEGAANHGHDQQTGFTAIRAFAILCQSPLKEADSETLLSWSPPKGSAAG